MFFFKQKTAYEMRISDWSSDVCSSDRRSHRLVQHHAAHPRRPHQHAAIDAPRLGGVEIDQPGRAENFALGFEIGRASCRESVCQYVQISVVAVSLKKKHTI